MLSTSPSALVYATLFLTLTSRTTATQQPDLETRDQGTWTNAYCLPSQPQDLSAATAATCPFWAPIACTAISEPGYCCTPSTYCARASDNTIGCCPWGQTCAPSIAGGAAQPQSEPQHSTWQQPTTQTQTQTATIYTTQTHPYAAPQVTTLVAGSYGQGQQGWGQGGQEGQGQWQGGGGGQVQGVQAGQQYCSTLYAHGPNLPTTEAGTCGTILILNAAGKGVEVGRWMIVGVWLVAGLVGISMVL